MVVVCKHEFRALFGQSVNGASRQILLPPDDDRQEIGIVNLCGRQLDVIVVGIDTAKGIEEAGCARHVGRKVTRD
jgi:hypothetical protein